MYHLYYICTHTELRKKMKHWNKLRGFKCVTSEKLTSELHLYNLNKDMLNIMTEYI